MKKLFPVAILAGGLGTRVKPLTETIPKALIEIEGEPFINHQLRLLKKQQIERVILCIGHLGEMIVEHVGTGQQYGLDVQYQYDGDPLLGTAGALKKALPLLGEAFFVLYGDSYLPINFQAIQEHFESQNRPGMMTVYKNHNLGDQSNVEYSEGEIIAYDKQTITSAMCYIDYGLGIFHRSAFNCVPENTRYDLAVLYQNLLQAKQLSAYEVKQRFYEIGSFTGIKDLSHYLQLEKEKL